MISLEQQFGETFIKNIMRGYPNLLERWKFILVCFDKYDQFEKACNELDSIKADGILYSIIFEIKKVAVMSKINSVIDSLSKGGKK